MSSTDSAMLDIIANSEISSQSIQKTMASYYDKLSSKISKGSNLTASDAKKEGPTIIKIVNLCMKQVEFLYFHITYHIVRLTRLQHNLAVSS